MSKPTTIVKTSSPTARPETGDFFLLKPAALVLEDGTAFSGQVPANQPDGQVGEVVFNTGMTGYVETLTDPSYSGQILTFTYPLIGNYGVPDKRHWESTGVHARGVVTSELITTYSHAGHSQSLAAWLKDQQVPVITAVDTRALTKHLRSRGTMTGVITTATHPSLRYQAPNKVTIARPTSIGPASAKHVILVDCGAKENIQRELLARQVRITRVPYDFDYTHLDYDAILLSNGPGDPSDYMPTVAILKKALADARPVFGICLGCQLMALAAGARTYKLLYGHRGHNQPVAAPDGRAYITSQNHGYAIDAASLPNNWSVTFRNLNDNSVEGIAHASHPHWAVQFHPEASPGPTDSRSLFDDFVRSL